MSLIKSKQRVRDQGEVFTPHNIVVEMCDSINDDIQNINTIMFEPTCGTGNFLEEIIKRRMSICNSKKDELIIMSNLYGIDIALDNVMESRERCKEYATCDLSKYIIDKNIIVGDIFKPETFNLTDWNIDDKNLYQLEYNFQDIINYRVDNCYNIELMVEYNPTEWNKDFVKPDVKVKSKSKSIDIFDEMFG